MITLESEQADRKAIEEKLVSVELQLENACKENNRLLGRIAELEAK